MLSAVCALLYATGMTDEIIRGHEGPAKTDGIMIAWKEGTRLVEKACGPRGRAIQEGRPAVPANWKSCNQSVKVMSIEASTVVAREGRDQMGLSMTDLSGHATAGTVWVENAENADDLVA